MVVLDRLHVNIVDLKVLAELGKELDTVVVQRKTEVDLRALMRDTSNRDTIEVAKKMAQADVALYGVQDVWQAFDILRGDNAESFDVIEDG